jgi:hypothetical protein
MVYLFEHVHVNKEKGGGIISISTLPKLSM